MKKLIFIAFFISGLCSALFAQTDKATVEGVVRDSDGKPLSFATMFIAELGTGVSTDLEGENMYTKELSANGIIVMGNEGNGIYVECFVPEPCRQGGQGEGR